MPARKHVRSETPGHRGPDSKRVLVIDDNWADLRAMCRRLEREGFDVTGLRSATRPHMSFPSGVGHPRHCPT